ncbi:hypothetical protein [Vibrio fluvialis]|uniref:hypothetical protein n=1 Tax=Vibrio fluvialis TaxID=676 RepID=UPI001EE9B226|nr:hypothetical protein [Vibrio fluvialis]MCG6387471.1 hypothetical protein [Vibrio fluvialis]
MKDTSQLITQIQKQANEIKRERRRTQFPKKNAPKLPNDLLITLTGGGVVGYFRLHKQTNNEIVIKTDEKLCAENGVDTQRILSYVKGVGSEVAIYGWNWRPTKWKGNKLFLTPVAPSIFE